MLRKLTQNHDLAMRLTWLRIFIIVPLIGTLYIPEHIIYPGTRNLILCLLFSIASITDALDGYLARKFCMTTDLGALLDTIADKLLVCSALVILLSLGRIDPIIAIIIIGREITITALRQWMSASGASNSVKVNWHGKAKAIAQMIAITFLLYHDRLLGIDIKTIGTVLIWIATALTIHSMIVYFISAISYTRKKTTS